MDIVMMFFLSDCREAFVICPCEARANDQAERLGIEEKTS